MLKSLLLAACIAYTLAVPIDNGVEGEPEIECGPTSITINFNTQKAFEGHVYVKGLYNEQGCRNDENGRQVAGITLPFDSCQVARTRSLNPKGVFVTTTVVITFHPHFITKVDRAYRIQCFYMEADKTVSQELEVSEITTAFQTQVVPMPVCRYDILDGGPTGAPVKFAIIGQAVYHKWTCDTETTDTFCMVVHSCFVDDGQGDKVDLLDEKGCARDKFLLRNLEYPTDLMAGQESHVFKYADRAQLFFQCQITITIKEPNQPCPRPECAEPTGFATGAGAPVGGGAAGPKPAGAAAPAGGASAAPAAGASPAAARPANGGARPAAAARPAAPARPASGGATSAAPAATSPAAAASPPAFLLLRKKREAWEENNAGVMDVRTEINALDLDDSLNGAWPNQSRQRRPDRYDSPVIVQNGAQQGVCLTTFGFTVFLALAVVMVVFIVVLVTCMLRPSPKF